MIPLFSEQGLSELRAFAQDGLLVALDYDGTLAPITDDPFRAVMQAQTRQLLARLSQRRHSVVITGRSRRDALRLLDGIEGVEVIGNHGMESARMTSVDVLELVAGWKGALAAPVAAIAGASLEDKGYSLTVHYRLAADPAQAGASVRAIAGQLPGARLIGGKCVLNIVPANAPDKGAAVLAELRRAGAARAIFVGDDVTDEDVFRLEHPGILSVRVGRSTSSRARYFLAHRGEVDTLLEWLGKPS